MTPLHILVIACAGVLCTGGACLVIRFKSISAFPGQKEWVSAFVLFIAALSVLLVKDYSSYPVLIILANAFQLLAYYMLILGSLRFVGKNFRDHWVIIIFIFFILAVLGSLVYEVDDISARLIVVAIFASILNLLNAYVFIFYAAERSKANQLAVLAFGFHGVFSLIKSFAIVFDTKRDSYFTQTLISEISLFEYVLMAFLYSIAMNMLATEKIRTWHSDQIKN